MSSSRSIKGKRKEHVPPTKWLWHKGGTSNQSNFESRHFSNKRLANQFHQKLMTCTVFPTLYILPDWLRSLSISNRNLLQFLEDVGWINALIIEENVYPDLVKVFYLNMDTSAEKESRVITNVGGVLIEFDVTELNSILGTSDIGLEIFFTKKAPDIDHFVHVDAVRNICRRIDLSDEVCTIHFRTQCLCLQSHILLCFIQTIVLPRSGHLDKVSHMDVALIDSILKHRPVNLGYTVIRIMLSIPNLISRSFPYGHFITPDP